ncbi:hydrolase [Virgisporangium aliadipatigenens]|uniref:Hydrolase n=1 Tax=Virgisporangium aliadipatigenens TaxID=741659 RepID=A0A8J4DS92_9ACTN|nr:alpha/beta fold hydrolase [Virgisporangium aliadipatigenens]GIJ48970.1 hydrolase [Virgisporangium aliadipatigenens]
MRIATNGTELAVRVDGTGAPLLLLHGWPHTGRIWAGVRPPGRRIIAPDLRGIGDSAPARDGFDAATAVADLIGLLDHLNVDTLEVAAIDAAVPTAFLLAMRHPERVTRLVLMEGTLPGLAGGFDAPPWWFGLHAVPELPETLVEGREDEYLGWFLRDVADPGLRAALVDAYRGRPRLRAGFGFYRAMDRNTELIRAAVAGSRLRVPTVAVAGGVVAHRLHRQLEPLTDHLRGVTLDRCGHIVPLDRPDALTRLFA